MKHHENHNDRVIRIFKEFFDMLQADVKTLEVRVLYHFMANIKVGTIFRFNNDKNCRFKVTAIRVYGNFEELLKNEDIKKIDPTRNFQQQLKSLRKIYPPEKEKIGPVIYEIERFWE